MWYGAMDSLEFDSLSVCFALPAVKDRKRTKAVKIRRRYTDFLPPNPKKNAQTTVYTTANRGLGKIIQKLWIRQDGRGSNSGLRSWGQHQAASEPWHDNY